MEIIPEERRKNVQLVLKAKSKIQRNSAILQWRQVENLEKGCIVGSEGSKKYLMKSSMSGIFLIIISDTDISMMRCGSDLMGIFEDEAILNNKSFLGTLPSLILWCSKYTLIKLKSFYGMLSAMRAAAPNGVTHKCQFRTPLSRFRRSDVSSLRGHLSRKLTRGTSHFPWKISDCHVRSLEYHQILLSNVELDHLIMGTNIKF